MKQADIDKLNELLNKRYYILFEDNVVEVDMMSFANTGAGFVYAVDDSDNNINGKSIVFFELKETPEEVKAQWLGKNLAKAKEIDDKIIKIKGL